MVEREECSGAVEGSLVGYVVWVGMVRSSVVGVRMVSGMVEDYKGGIYRD